MALLQREPSRFLRGCARFLLQQIIQSRPMSPFCHTAFDAIKAERVSLLRFMLDRLATSGMWSEAQPSRHAGSALNPHMRVIARIWPHGFGNI